MQTDQREQTKFFLLQKNETRGAGFCRTFSALDDNVVVKVVLGAVLEQSLLDRSESDLDFFLNYILVLKTRFQEKKHYGLEVLGTEMFHKRLLLFFAELKEYLAWEPSDVAELLDDYYLLFLNKHEETLVLLLKALVLGLGSSFEIEKKVSQQTISFDYDSRVFKNFLALLCKLFGCVLEVKIGTQSPEVFQVDPSSAKVPMGKGSVIRIEIVEDSTINLIYDDEFFTSRDVPLEAINYEVNKGVGSNLQFDEAGGINNSSGSSGKKNGSNDWVKKNMPDREFMDESNYLSNHNIINPYSLYNSNVDFKCTSHIDQDAVGDVLVGMEHSKKEMDPPIRLEDFYSKDLEENPGQEFKMQLPVSEFSSNPQPGLRIREPKFGEKLKLHMQESEDPHYEYEFGSNTSPNFEPRVIRSPAKRNEMYATEIDSSSDEEPKPVDNEKSEEPSILYKYDLEQSIDFVNGTNYFESVANFKESGTTLSPVKGIGDNIQGHFMAAESEMTSNQDPEQMVVSEKVRSTEKRGTLSDHIKLLLNNEYETKATQACGDPELKQNQPLDLVAVPYITRPELISDFEVSKQSVEERDDERVKPIITTVTDIQPGVSSNQLSKPASPPKTQVSYNPLMVSLNRPALSPETSAKRENEGPKHTLKPLLAVSEDSLSKKRPTANVELMQQINQAFLAKLMSDSGHKQAPLAAVDRPMDMTPLDDKTSANEQSGNPKTDEKAPSTGRQITRKTKLMTQSGTEKPCRLCQKVYKLAKMYHYDGSFFCERCYSTACHKLRKKAINSCAGCSREPTKVLIVKFILSNKFTKSKGSLLFTRDKKVEPFYGYLHKYSQMLAKSKDLEWALQLISNNIATPLTTWAEVKCCKECTDLFFKCCMCKDVVQKNELFSADACNHPYCLDCLCLIFLKKYVEKKEFTCKASFCWKKTSLEKTLHFITSTLETVQNEINQSGPKAD